MGTLPQTGMTADLTTPLGPDALVITDFMAVEALGEPFAINIGALSRRADIDAALGASCTVALRAGAGGERFFNGILTCAQRLEQVRGSFRYALVLRPWLHLLEDGTGSRIFLNMTVTDIITEVFTGAGFRDFEFRLAAHYPVMTNCAQYRESDLAFCTRLMERHGIWYFFEHVDGRHTLIMADRPSAHRANPGAPQLTFVPDGETGEERMREPWIAERLRRTAGIASRTGSGGPAADRRRYAGGNAAALFPGSLVTIRQHPEDEENRTFLVVRCAHRFTQPVVRPQAPPPPGRGDGEPAGDPFAAGPACEGTYELQPDDRPFQPAAPAARPQIAGVQTAKVAAHGAGGGEIRPDENGCIPLHFQWDRPPRQPCPVPVAQIWSGLGHRVPAGLRPGTEVVVAFLDGDPDRPLVTGFMANGAAAVGTRAELPAIGDDQFFVAGGAAGRNPEEPEEAGPDRPDGDRAWTISGSRTFTIRRGDHTVNVQFGDQTVNISHGHQTVNALQSITLNVCLGSSVLAITPGAVTIKSPVINLNADTMINLNAPLTAIPGGAVIVIPGPLTGFGSVVPPA